LIIGLTILIPSEPDDDFRITAVKVLSRLPQTVAAVFAGNLFLAITVKHGQTGIGMKVKSQDPGRAGLIWNLDGLYVLNTIEIATGGYIYLSQPVLIMLGLGLMLLSLMRSIYNTKLQQLQWLPLVSSTFS
jgi:hypothetical protein